jgi:hypothetical protein
MRKSKGNSGKIFGKSAKQLMKILVCRKYSEMALLYYFILAGKQHNEPFSQEISR